jgi:hypothetical protein
MIGLNHINPPPDRILVLLDLLVPAFDFLLIDRSILRLVNKFTTSHRRESHHDGRGRVRDEPNRAIPERKVRASCM